MAADYQKMLAALLPFGRAWGREQAGTLMRLMDGLSREFPRVDARAVELAAGEALPDTTDELIREWERMVGLPDECDPSPPVALAERRAAVLARLVNSPQSTAAYFVALGALLGYTITITEGAHPLECDDECDDELNTELSRFWWRVFTATMGGVDDELECLFNRLKPAHTFVSFHYSGDGWGMLWGYNWGG